MTATTDRPAPPPPPSSTGAGELRPASGGGVLNPAVDVALLVLVIVSLLVLGATFMTMARETTTPASPAPLELHRYQPVLVDPSGPSAARYGVELQVRAFYRIWAQPGTREQRAAALGPWMAPSWLDNAVTRGPTQDPGEQCCEPRAFTLGPDGAVLYRFYTDNTAVIQIQGHVDAAGRLTVEDIQG